MFPENTAKVRVAVGSMNPVKIRAARNVFRRFYREVEILPFDAQRGVRLQPLGFEETVKGAMEVARMALRQGGEVSFGVGIEAGLIPLPYSSTWYGDQQFAAIIDRRGTITVGGGPVFEYPPAVTEQVLTEKVEVGVAMERLTGIENLGRRQGVIGYLSHKILNRAKLTEQAILMAVIPRLNAELYFSATKKN